MYELFTKRNYNPFLEDTSPIPSGKGVFGKNNSGGRWLRPNSSVDILDQVGKETRPVQDDLCIQTETGGGGVYYATSATLTKWAFAIRGKGYIEDITSEFLAGNYNDGAGVFDAVMLRSALGQYITYADSASTLYAWDGTGNTSLTPPPSDPTTPFDLLFFSDGTDVHLYLNGVYRGYVTPSGTTGFDLTYLLRAYSVGAFGPYSSNGQYYDARLWDLTLRSPVDIVFYMFANSNLYHYDAMPKADGWTKRILGLNEKTGTESVDTGDATPVNGVYYSTDPAVTVSNLHQITLFPEWIQNQHNKYGYKIDGTRVIPNTPNGTNVLGTPDYFKSVKYNAEITDGDKALFTGTASQEINAGSGSEFDILAQENFWLAGSFISFTDAFKGIAGPSHSGAANKYYIYILSSKIWAAVYFNDGTSKTASLAYNIDTLYNFIFYADRDGDMTLYMAENSNSSDISGADNSLLTPVNDFRIGARSSSSNLPELIFNGYISQTIFGKGELTSTQIEDARYGDFSSIIPIATRCWMLNGHSIDSITGIAAASNLVTYSGSNTVATQAVKSHLKGKWYLLVGGEKVADPQYALPGGATEKKPGYDHAFTFITDFDPIDTRPTQAIGHQAHLLMNRLCYTGNAFGYPEYWDGAAQFITDTDLANPYAWKDCSMDYIILHANAVAIRLIYQYLFDSRVKDIIIFANPKTLGEETTLTSLGWEKTY